LIITIQNYRSKPLDYLMTLASFLGNEFFFILVPLFSWWGNKEYRKLGLTLFLLLHLMLFLVSGLKILFQRERPWRLNSSILKPEHDSAAMIEFSFPSGHAWASTSFFFLAFQLKKPVFWILAFIACLITSFSRLYFGVHYPHDIVGGLLCGVIFLTVFLTIQNIFEKRKLNTDKILTVMGGIALSLMMAIYWMMEPTMRDNQPGLLFVPFCMLGIVFLTHPFIPVWNCSNKKLRFYRIVMGTPVIILIAPLFVKVSPLYRPLVACFIGIWTVTLGPIFFEKIGMVSKEILGGSIENKENKENKTNKANKVKVK